MKDEITICPCGQGTLVSEVIEDYPNEHTEIYYYSCGHKHEKTKISVKTGVKFELKTKSFGGIQIGKKKREYEIEDRYRKNEVPLQKIWLFYKTSEKHHKWDIYMP